jgi:FixJ family two-component response regulator
MLTKLELVLTCQPDANETKEHNGYCHKERQALYRSMTLTPAEAEVIFQRIEDFATEQLAAFMGTAINTKTGYRA